MASSLNEGLASIAVGQQRMGRSTTLALLRPALPPEEAGSRLVDGSVPVVRELVELYSWHDGTTAAEGAVLDDMHLVPGFYLCSLDEALTNLRTFHADTRWDPAWLPIMANGGGDFMVVDCSGEGSESAPVRHFRLEESEHPVEYQSVTQMVATFAAAFDRGVFVMDDDGHLEMDDHAFAALAAELNPDVSWWKS